MLENIWGRYEGSLLDLDKSGVLLGEYYNNTKGAIQDVPQYGEYQPYTYPYPDYSDTYCEPTLVHDDDGDHIYYDCYDITPWYGSGWAVFLYLLFIFLGCYLCFWATDPWHGYYTSWGNRREYEDFREK